MNKTHHLPFIPVVLIFAVIAVSVFLVIQLQKPAPPAEFDSDRAYSDVLAQVALGPRTPGSQAHEDVVRYIQKELVSAGWKVTLQNLQFDGHEVKNVIATRSNSTQPATILGAHYDSRLLADQDVDPFLARQPVPGANDGASGVAVLLELARVMPSDLTSNVWLVFFDAEDQGDLPGWDWILGSQAFVSQLTQPVAQAVIVDMVGDQDLNLYREKSSDPSLVDALWSKASSLGYAQYFINTPKYTMLDDHTPFLNSNIPAVDIIDFDYPYWHTAADLPDRVSPHSLEIVGKTLLAWLSNK